MFLALLIFDKYQTPIFTNVLSDSETPKCGDAKVINKFMYFEYDDKCLRHALASTPPKLNPIKLIFLNNYEQFKR